MPKRYTPAEAAEAIEAMKPPTKRQVPGDLHPAVFPHRVRMNQDDAADPNLEIAEKAFGDFSRALDQLHNREVTIKSDRTRTAADHAVRLAKLASDALDPVAKRSQAARERLQAAIQGIDGDIERAKRAKLSQPEQQEIRAHLRSLTPKKRNELLAAADDDVMAAALAGKPFLSGMTDAEALAVEHKWLTRRFPNEHAARAKYQAAIEQLDSGWAGFMRHVGRLRDPNAADLAKGAADADKAATAAISLD